MKKIILSLACICWFAWAHSQSITFKKTLSAALTQSATSHKLVFVVVQPSVLHGHADLASALDSPAVARFFKDGFISYKYDSKDTAAISLLKINPINVFPAYLFLDSNKNLVYKQFGASLITSLYFDMGQKAISIYRSGRTLTNYNLKYANGNREIDFLKDYISLREELGLIDNAKLIDEYVDLLTVSSLQDYRQILFILKAGPIMYSKAYNACFFNQKIIDSIYKTESPALTSSLNGTIANNTINEAIATKNISMVQQVIAFRQRGSNYSPRQIDIMSQQTMLNYYKAIKDTASYFFQASWIYDGFYMAISADSAKKIAAKKIDPFLDYAKRSRLDTTKFKITKTDSKYTGISPAGTKSINIIVKDATPPPPGNVAEELNNIAYEFYTTGTRNQAHLAKAMLWSKRSIEIDPTYYSYDTLAHILYRLGFFDEAQFTQNKAITLAKVEKVAPDELANLKLELSKINSKQL